MSEKVTCRPRGCGRVRRRGRGPPRGSGAARAGDREGRPTRQGGRQAFPPALASAPDATLERYLRAGIEVLLGPVPEDDDGTSGDEERAAGDD
ncbi:hypothetical protein QF034_007575 [Streptomyces africanus]|uniref:Uncharacterized protein n=1 Tax=Streptomyces africanus TaxID=231024 RepID=A0ABU0R3L8_9ACTN|nr:hypothetical protein [Streptomyces africanus]MDQ0753344.1 hypothetical protein [Streptomyces africanus]